LGEEIEKKWIEPARARVRCSHDGRGGCTAVAVLPRSMSSPPCIRYTAPCDLNNNTNILTHPCSTKGP